MAPIKRTAHAAYCFFLIASTLAVFSRLPCSTLHFVPATYNERRRQLDSIDLLQCPELNRPPPQLPPLPTMHQATYVASFPGSGDRMITQYFIESTTGLFVGEAAVSPSLSKMKALSQSHIERPPQQEREEGAALVDAGGEMVRGQGEVVAVRSHFPHTSGKLASWDDDLPRAVVVLRNPLHAIPIYFNQMYEMRFHMSTGHSMHPEHSTGAHAAWIKWRDNQLRSQTMLYRRFVSFWMEKYLNHEGDRIYFSYEEFTDQGSGSAEAVRLVNFLEEGMKASAIEWATSWMKGQNATEGQNAERVGLQQKDELRHLFKGQSSEEFIDDALGEATKTLVNLEDVPCLWKEVVHSKQSETRNTSGDSFSFDGGWTPADRPYTPENLAAMSGMLLELMNRWSRHQRVLTILSKYHREVNLAYLEATGKLKAAIKQRDKFDQRNTKKEQTLRMEEPQQSSPAIQTSKSDNPASVVVTKSRYSYLPT